MNDRNFLGLTVLHGTLNDLYIDDGEEEFVRGSGEQLAASGAAAGLALAGLAGAATNALFAAGGGGDSVQNFTATLSGQRIAGRFSKVWFQNGDELEVAAQPQKDGSFAVYAVRRPSDQTLWMFPHCSRGGKAHWKYAWKMVFVLFGLIGILLGGGFLIAHLIEEDLHKGLANPNYVYFLVGLIATNSALIASYFSLNTARRWKRFVNIAEEVFAVLGYKDPANVDMTQLDSTYWKKYAKPGEQRSAAPWVFRYANEQ